MTFYHTFTGASSSESSTPPVHSCKHLLFQERSPQSIRRSCSGKALLFPAAGGAASSDRKENQCNDAAWIVRCFHILLVTPQECDHTARRASAPKQVSYLGRDERACRAVLCSQQQMASRRSTRSVPKETNKDGDKAYSSTLTKLVSSTLNEAHQPLLSNRN